LRRGIGRKLLEFGDEQFARANCKRAILLVFKENVDAHTFYQKCGWRDTGEERPEPIDETDIVLTVTVMERDIPTIR
jgi:ribosomal protein S18 acetylase RimI-like enzyme